MIRKKSEGAIAKDVIPGAFSNESPSTWAGGHPPIKSAFERRGIRTADRYYVLDWKGELDGPVSSKYNGQMYYLIPSLGAFFSIVVLAGGGITLLNRKRRQSALITAIRE